jgi:hypothetical protein
MSYAPPTPLLGGPEDIVSPLAGPSIAPYLYGSDYFAPGSAIWPVANAALLIPFVLSEPGTVYELGWHNGSVVSGNCDAGIYDAAGTLLVSTGSTAQAGVSSFQQVNIADTAIPARALHYLAFAMDNITGRMTRLTPQYKWCGIMGLRYKTSSFALPNPLTGTSEPPSNFSYIPVVFAKLRNT